MHAMVSAYSSQRLSSAASRGALPSHAPRLLPQAQLKQPDMCTIPLSDLQSRCPPSEFAILQIRPRRSLASSRHVHAYCMALLIKASPSVSASIVAPRAAPRGAPSRSSRVNAGSEACAASPGGRWATPAHDRYFSFPKSSGQGCGRQCRKTECYR